MSYLETGDSTLFYTVTGSGTPVVLVHGWTADSIDFSWLIPLLEPHFRVIAYDLRGYGKSAPADAYDMGRQLDDLTAVIEHVAGEPALVVGHSLGGAIVSSMAAERPERLLGVVALDAPYAVGEDGRSGVEGMRERLAGEHPQEVVKSFFSQVSFTDQTPDWLRTLVLRRVESVSSAMIRAGFAALWDHAPVAFRPESDRYLARRTGPVLVVHKNAASAAYEEATFQHPASRTVVLPGAGHWVQIERAEEVSAAILDWWTTARAG
ncbi:alpha/beta fold hydrolase [Pseudonocardia alaniniphila]|uniref:Alpha/beta hydrolase n=1 Tax=Pseudonocardia alaniniphila TaxID=75291 RepID=A0ABS9TEX8_9PSEU|nr:alpha/beta hydrolase [Pseudonocardia alaniniphila]MCH6166958.1 alpha/beta hydrolase [Pseudonocardia alaniniphila]